MAEVKTNDLMEKIVSLCKRRGFIYQSSEIYGGINGFWDYGPLGSELKRNVRELWWRSMTRFRDDIVGLDATIIMHPKIWEASGHVSTFADPMSTCKVCKKLIRTDQVWEIINDSEWGRTLSGFLSNSALDEEKLLQWVHHRGHRQVPGLALVKNPNEVIKALKLAIAGNKDLSMQEFFKIVATDPSTYTSLVTPCPYCGGELTEPRMFNLMFKTHVGPVADEENVAYLRPETAQAIFVQFKNILETSRQKVPFGICQIGKAFRNEVTPRNFTFRSREFEQMELEFFIRPDEVVEKLAGKVAKWGEGADLSQPKSDWGWEMWHRHWVEERVKWYESIGLSQDTLELYWQQKEELAHYAKACVDIQFKFPFGTQELEGIAARGDFDLTQHQKFSGKSMEYFDEEAKARYVPHVIEPSAGVDRLVLALICKAYSEDEVPDESGKPEQRVVMRFHPRVAPIKVGVFPLLKNKPQLVQKAKEVRELLRPYMTVFYDEAGAIGRRYRRQDEAGTPYGVTIDF
ncbi:MAG TPA: glycine--tRNA ligase, partial [Verrucomicrobiota bacterium]|nr:glycine--tRNA ligase [Verrucomicrobiota bacterium]